VPFTGVVHFGKRVTPLGGSQHSSPCWQHWAPQQNWLAPQKAPLQGGSMHAPLWQ